MLFEIILAIIFGILAGTLTGLIPGIHINLIAVILLSYSAYLLELTLPLTLAIFITAMAITHTFLDFIPSIFLGAPDEDSFLSILPGHKFLLKGKAHHAIILTLYGSLSALLIIILLIPIFILFLPFIYQPISNIMPFILILIAVFLILKEPQSKIWAFIIFLLAGFLGTASSDIGIKQPLLPLLTGLFGASSLVISINRKIKIPEQITTSLKNIKLTKKSFAKSISASLIASPFTAFIPAVGASQAAVIGNQVIPLNQEEFLFLLGAINTIVMALSFVTFYVIGKTRTGAVVAVSQLLPEITNINLLLIVTTITISGIISFYIAIFISKFSAKKINKIKYSKLSIIILAILTIVVFLFSDFFNPLGGILGLLVFITSISLGITCIELKIRRIHLMGALIIPTILFYL
ncbi:hypothetical protein GF386_03835 [Candidatus Pacearchaeota archaeon]|nr:hypothetical protein [Candidatus Pacearchaeota archaeon]MBD3283277.1 hypothetical protein [Candidatus Pacearchaeota archaeon]